MRIENLLEKFNRKAVENGYDSISMQDFLEWIEEKINEEWDETS